jgi:uncharacterized iron-regulated membrane protein
LRPLAYRLHFYAGIMVAPFLVVAAVTGGLYALAPTVERLIYHDVLSVDPVGQAQPLNQQVTAAQAVAGDLALAGLRPAAGTAESTRVYFQDPTLPPRTHRAVFVNPYTAEVLGDQKVWKGHLPIQAWLDRLHRELHLGEPGRLYTELAASWLWVLALGGLYLWVHRWRAERRRGRGGRLLRVDTSTRGRSRTLGRHSVTGVWILLGLLFLSATGITWSRYAGAHVSDLRQQLHWQQPQLGAVGVGGRGAPAGHHHTPVEPASASSGGIDFDEVVAVAAQVDVRAPVEATVQPHLDHAVAVTEVPKPYRARTNTVIIDTTTLKMTDRLDFDRDYPVAAKLAAWGIRAHMGSLFGLLNQLVLLAVAVGLLVVIIQGYRMWWQRRPTRGPGWAVGRPPRRGGLTKLSPLSATIVVAAAAGIGWFLPLLGVSLIGFLVLDIIWGASRTTCPAGSPTSPRPDPARTSEHVPREDESAAGA